MPRVARILLAVVVALSAATPTRAARAEDEPKQEELPRRVANFAWDKNDKTGLSLLRANFSYRDIVDKSMADKLASGLPTVIAMRAYVKVRRTPSLSPSERAVSCSIFGTRSTA